MEIPAAGEPREVTLFPYLPYPLDTLCSGSGFYECECYEDKPAQVGAYAKPITRPGPYLREILLLCDSCRQRLEASGDIKVLERS
jgi:hypothetical protein